MKRPNSITQGAAAVVTGAGSGIGRSFALEIARRGGSVICVDIKLADADATVAQLQALGAHAVARAVDVSQADAMARLAEEAPVLLGRPVSLLINNAGVGLAGRMGEVSLADWQWCLGVNLWGVVHGCHHFVPQLRRLGHGGIINVASGAAFSSLPEMAAYNTSKAAVVALSETLAAELAPAGIAVNVLCPSVVPTNIFDNSRMDDRHRRSTDLVRRWATFTTSDAVAKRALDDLDAGVLHTLPQPDSRLIWWLKRQMPAGWSRLSGLVYGLGSA